MDMLDIFIVLLALTVIFFGAGGFMFEGLGDAREDKAIGIYGISLISLWAIFFFGMCILPVILDVLGIDALDPFYKDMMSD